MIPKPRLKYVFS